MNTATISGSAVKVKPVKKKRAKKTRQGAGRGTKKKYNKYKGQGGRKR